MPPRSRTGRHGPPTILLLTAVLALRSGSPSPALGGEGADASPAGEVPRTALDLLTNRVHMVLHRRDRLVVSADDPAFLKFVDGGWKGSWILGERDGAKRVAYVAGLSASLNVPLDVDGDGPARRALDEVPLRLTVRALAPGQRLTVFVNDRAVGTVEVPRSYATVKLTVPSSALVIGENRIRLTFRSAAALSGGRRSAAAVERLELGEPLFEEPTPPPLVGDVELGGDRRRALNPGGPSRLSYYVQVPAGGRLALAYGATTQGAIALIRIATDGAGVRVLQEGPAGARWTEGSWDLGGFEDQAVRIDLVARGGGVAWAEPRLLAPGPAHLAPPAHHRIDRIFIWMVDTLRADKVHVYNPKTVVQTPNYDAFAAEATRFAWMAVPGTWSLPSHASILTGVYPTVHEAIAHDAKVSTDVPFVAELMRKAGYRTGMFSSNGYVSSKWGFDRGWEKNRNFIRESLPNSGAYLWKVARTWVLGNGTHRQFAYLATVEPHVIYNPKKPYLLKYWNKPYGGPIKPVQTGIQLGLIKSGKLKVTDTDKAYIEALHNAEITESDDYFGTFLDDLRASGLYDSSAVVVISDHGEEFWDHGDVGHAQSVHQELVHVPLIIRAPGAFPAGKVVNADVEAMDLFPTLLDLAGIPIPPETQGSSLLPLVDWDLPPRAAWSQNTGVSRGLKVGRYRLIHNGARIELYDELADPTEKVDVARRRPIALRQMRNVFSLLAAYEDRWKKRSWGTAADVTEAFYTATAR